MREIRQAGDSRRGKGLVRSGAVTLAASGTVMLLGLATGVIVARGLGADGRGSVAAIQVVATFAAWAAGSGCLQAVTYHQTRSPADACALISTWLLLLVPLGTIAVASAYFLVPVVLAAQPTSTQNLARWFASYAIVAMTNDLFIGVILGDGDFRVYSVVRTAVPALTLAAYIGLVLASQFTVATASFTGLGVSLVITVGISTHVLRRHGLARPSWQLAQRTLWYGFRGHGTTVALFLNARLDALILPAFVGATQLGLYSMATNVSWTIYSFAGALYVIVIPAAAHRESAAQARIVFLSLYTALGIAVVLGVVVELFAPLAVREVYGESFSPGVPALRILLPGAALYAGASVLWQGLYATGRPFLSSLCQMTGLVVTVVGLLVFLPRHGGIFAAALISTGAYSITFVASLVLFSRAVGLRSTALFRVRHWMTAAKPDQG